MFFTPSTPISSIDGIVEKTYAEFQFLGINSVYDLMMLKASNVEKRNTIVNFSSIQESGTINTFVKVVSKIILPSKVLKVVVEDICDDSNYTKAKSATLWCFGRNFLNRFLSLGNVYYLYGKAVRKFEFNNSLQISSFDIKPAFKSGNFYSADGYGLIKNNYSISNQRLNLKISITLENVLKKFDWSDYDFGLTMDVIKKFDLLSAREAFYLYHFPKDEESLEKARRSLSYIEINNIRSPSPIKENIHYDMSFNDVENKLIQSLDFDLTKSQKVAILDIFSDLENQGSTFRFLQGDVGSGKTICALLCIFHEVLKGKQSVFIAPTEILAYQHYLTARKIFRDYKINIEFISSKTKKNDRKKILDSLADGSIDVIFGTHSLLNDDLEFKSLSFAVIDEEQRFGVEQKQRLLSKGENIKTLMMSATPIPRSILKIFSQGYEYSVLENFKDMSNVKTFLVSQDRREEAYNCIKSEFSKGNCAYFVVPRIDDESSELKNIKQLEEQLVKIFSGIKYAVITSRTKEDEKMNVLKSFLDGEIQYILSTSVVEVGMDNKKATCIVVEDADTFGLATLHQLRGRVGRAGQHAWCFYVYRDEITEHGKERLRLLKNENDGFKIAEFDLSMRGGGDIVGIRQSGKSTLKFFDYEKDQDFL